MNKNFIRDELRKVKARLKQYFLDDMKSQMEAMLMNQGKLLRARNAQIIQNLRAQKMANNAINGGGGTPYLHAFYLEDSEFKIFSQNGEDGILDFIIQALDSENLLADYERAFIEFGVENYTESNTRYLLQERKYEGLIMDGSQENIDYVRRRFDAYDLASKAVFITKDNINDLISSWLNERGLKPKITLLSIDIDGNDYHIWDTIDCIEPAIVTIEYNAELDTNARITIPYNPDFCWHSAHSRLYFGASLGAMDALAKKKGYTFLGADSQRVNLFFVKNELFSALDFVKVRDFKDYKRRAGARWGYPSLSEIANSEFINV